MALGKVAAFGAAGVLVGFILRPIFSPTDEGSIFLVIFCFLIGIVSSGIFPLSRKQKSAGAEVSARGRVQEPDRVALTDFPDHESLTESAAPASIVKDNQSKSIAQGRLSVEQGRTRSEESRSSSDGQLQDFDRGHVVILVHGIRDFALWQNAIRATLEEDGFTVEATNYGRFNAIQFLLPVSYFRRKAIAAVWNQLRIVKQNNPNARLSIIAHSFGTFVVSHLMKDNFDIEFHRVIFCGSVVPYNFQFEQFQSRFTAPIVNEVGTRDIWPAMAETLTSGYGSAGTYGFRRPLIRDRWHNGARHGYFLDPAFCKTFWSPFLRDGALAADVAVAERPSVLLQFFSIFKIKYVIILVVLLSLIRLIGSSGFIDLLGK